MTTPRGAEHRDLEQRLRNVENQLRALTGAALRRGQLSVTSGDFVVSGGGAIVWQDATGLTRMHMRTVPSQVTPGSELSNLLLQGTSGAQAIVGDIEDTGDGTVRTGMLVQNPDGSDVLWVMHGTNAGKLHLTPTSDDQLDLSDASGNLRATLGPVTWGGNADGYGLYIAQADGDDVFYASQQLLVWCEAGSQALTGLVVNSNTILGGGVNASGSGTRSAIQLTGYNANAAEVRARDGGNSTYIPVAASNFIARSSSADTKTVLGDVAGALDSVRRTPIKRWRYRPERAPKDSTGELARPADAQLPEHVGPMAEDAPAAVAEWADGEGGLNLGHATWLTWRAVQELADENDALRTRVDDLEQRLMALEAKAS